MTSLYTELEPNELTERDLIVMLMGLTGSGKSTFISAAVDQGAEVGSGLESCTEDVRAIRVPNPNDQSHPFVLVDTPGFDNTYKSDTEILKMIADWLNKRYEANMFLSGIIYLHRISDNTMTGAPHKILRMFANLCGSQGCKNVIFATTMWSLVPSAIGEAREHELKDEFWRPMLDFGSSDVRFGDSKESAWDIIRRASAADARADLLLQEEMIDLKRNLSETQAGMVLYSSLQKMLAEYRETVHKLQEEIEKQDNPVLVKEMRAEYEKTQQQLNKTFEEIKQMKIPLSRRIVMLYSFKRSRGRSVKIFG